MTIKCVCNTGSAFLHYQMPLGYFESSEFDVVVGKEYAVMGLVLSENLLFYLIDDNSKVGLYPFQLFDLCEGSLKADWYAVVFNVSDDVYPYRQMVAGYFELCFNKQHYPDLIDGNEIALKTYFSHKHKWYGQ